MTADMPLALTETWHLDDSLAEIWRRTEPHACRRKYAKGSVVCRQGEPSTTFYFVLSGRVSLCSTSRTGSSFTYAVLGGNSMFGIAAVIDGQAHITDAVALEDTELLEFDVRTLFRLLPERHDLALSLIKLMANKQCAMMAQLQYVSHFRPEIRVGGFLLHMMKLYGEEQDGKTLIPVALTHEQIAGLTGTSRVSVTRAFKHLSDLGVIEIKKRRIWILDPDRLV